MKLAPLACSFALIAALAPSPAAVADENRHAEDAEQHHPRGDHGDRFSERERRAIRDYYRHAEGGGKHKDKSHRERALPKGLQKKLARGGGLPPGWQRKLEQGAALTPELRAAGEPLPRALTEALDPDGQADEILRIEDKVVRVSRGEGTIVDVIDLVDLLGGGHGGQ